MRDFDALSVFGVDGAVFEAGVEEVDEGEGEAAFGADLGGLGGWVSVIVGWIVEGELEILPWYCVRSRVGLNLEGSDHPKWIFCAWQET